MAINSYGFPGGIPAIRWAQLAEFLGERYGVLGYPDFRVTPVTGPDRTVQVAVGTAFGRGVMDVSDTPINIQLDAGTGSAGTVRYDLIALRRTWGVSNSSAIVKINGTSSPTIPGGRLANPGVQDDQPLALVKITTGSNVPVVEVDLRAWPSKSVTVADLRALIDSTFGDQALVGELRYRRALDATGNEAWVQDEQPWSSWTPGWNFSVTNGGIGNGVLRGRYRLLGSNTCSIEMQLLFGSTTSGGVGDWSFTYPPGIRPSTNVDEHWINAKVWVPKAGGQFPASAWLRPDRIWVYSAFSSGDCRQYVCRNSSGPASGPVQDSIPHLDNDFAWGAGANIMVNGTFETA